MRTAVNRVILFTTTAFLFTVPFTLDAGEPRPVFEDSFSRDELGETWRTAIGSFQIRDGRLVGCEDPKDGHGAVTQTYLDFSDLILEFRFQFQGSPSFNVVIDDRHYDASHAGHICRVQVSKTKGSITLGDDKTGMMENSNFELLRDPAQRQETLKRIASTRKEFQVDLNDDQWYRLRVSIMGDTMTCDLDDRAIGSITSPGIAHHTKTDFGFTVQGPAVLIDDVRASIPVSTGPTWIYGASSTTQDLVRATITGDGSLNVVERVPLEIVAGPVAWNPNHRLIYVADTRSREDGDGKGLAFKVASDGRLMKETPLEFDHGYAYLSLDRTGKYLLCASYGEGHIDVYRLDERGFPAERLSTRYEGRDKAHAILTSPGNRFVYVPYVKDQNAIYQYRFDSSSGRLTPLAKSEMQPPEGTGPRHIAFHPSRPLVFFSNEQRYGATSYRMEKDGQLSVVQVCDSLPEYPIKGQSASDIALTRGGRLLFTGLRGGRNGINAICRYAVHDDGRLSFLGRTEADEIPWGIQLTPDERHLLVSSTAEGTLSAYQISDDGDLKRVSSIDWGESIRDMVVVKSESDGS